MAQPFLAGKQVAEALQTMPTIAVTVMKCKVHTDKSRGPGKVLVQHACIVWGPLALTARCRIGFVRIAGSSADMPMCQIAQAEGVTAEMLTGCVADRSTCSVM